VQLLVFLSGEGEEEETKKRGKMCERDVRKGRERSDS
jgi:hypothetical protein